MFTVDVKQQIKSNQTNQKLLGRLLYQPIDVGKSDTDVDAMKIKCLHAAAHKNPCPPCRINKNAWPQK